MFESAMYIAQLLIKQIVFTVHSKQTNFDHLSVWLKVPSIQCLDFIAFSGEFPDALQESSGWSSHKNNSNLLTVIALLFNVGVASHLAFNLQVHCSLSKFTALAKT